MRADWWVFDVICLQRQTFDLLRQAGDHHIARREADLAAFVQEDSRELQAQNYLSSLGVIQSGKPDLAPIREPPKPCGLVLFDLLGHLWETRLQCFGRCVMPNARDDVIEPEPADQMPGAWRF